VLVTDLVISPFGADAAAMVDLARRAEEHGFGGVWTLDHFSGSMLERGWSRDPFTVLGAMAAVTTAVRVGPLVANMMNHHPSRLASAAGTLQSLSGGRAVLGVGAGAAPGSKYAGEHDAIGTALLPGPQRRRRLVETIEALRVIWAGGGDYDGEYVTLRGLGDVVGPEPTPPVVVGANGRGTVAVACRHADGVNIVEGPATAELARHARELAGDRPFEISTFAELDLEHPLGGPVDELVAAGVDRRALAVKAPFPLEVIAAIATRLATL